LKFHFATGCFYCSQQEFNELITDWKASDDNESEMKPWKISEAELLSQREKVCIPQRNYTFNVAVDPRGSAALLFVTPLFFINVAFEAVKRTADVWNIDTTTP
jgi:hypothetical protein